MKNTLTLLVALGIVFYCVLPASGDPVQVKAAPLPSVQPVASVVVAVPDVAATPTSIGDMQHDEMKQYTLWVMDDWTRALASEPVASYDDIADDIASAVVLHEDAVLLAGLAYFEGARYAAYVDGYQCNDADWRASDEGRRLMRVWGDCDGGHAYSIWQIHPIVDRSSKLYDLCNIEMIGPMGSRYNAARCALAIARASVQAAGDLSGYTGEAPVEGGHPKADERLRFIERAVAKHPWHT